MKNYFVLILGLSFNLLGNGAPILILTHHHNRADFIELQHKTFKRFLSDPYRLLVFNDASVPHIKKRIENTCKKLKIECITIPQDIHSQPYLRRWPGEGWQSPSVRTANAIQFSLNTRGFLHKGIVMIIDSDMFLIRPFSLKQFMSHCDLAGVYQGRGHKGNYVKYLWNGLVFLNIPSLPDCRTLDFNCGFVGGVSVDTGGQTCHYLTTYPNIKIEGIDVYHVNHLKGKNNFLERGFLPAEVMFLKKRPENIEFLLKKTFLHYRAGQNWEKRTVSYHLKKYKLINDFIDCITR